MRAPAGCGLVGVAVATNKEASKKNKLNQGVVLSQRRRAGMGVRGRVRDGGSLRGLLPSCDAAWLGDVRGWSARHVRGGALCAVCAEHACARA